MRSCYSLSSLCGFSRAAWRHAVAGTPRLGGGSHQKQQDNLRYLSLRSPAPPNALGLPERFFSSSSTKRSTKKSAAKKRTPVDPPAGDPFYVVRKGDVTSIYKNLADCQAQVSNSVCNPSVAVYKGYSLRKETEEYLAACGLKNALYSINAADARDELFGVLAPCPFQQPDGNATCTMERPQEMLKETGPLKEHPKVAELEPLPDSHVQGVWRTRRDHIVDLCNQVEQMKGRFLQFQIIQVLKKFNADADALAKSAVELPVGGIQEQSNITC